MSRGILVELRKLNYSLEHISPEMVRSGSTEAFNEIVQILLRHYNPNMEPPRRRLLNDQNGPRLRLYTLMTIFSPGQHTRLMEKQNRATTQGWMLLMLWRKSFRSRNKGLQSVG